MTPTATELVQRAAARGRPTFLQAVKGIALDDFDVKQAVDVAKAGVNPMTLTDPNSAGPLGALDGTRQFRELVLRRAVPGREEFLATPFSTPVPFQTADAVASWVGEAQPTPVSKLAFLANTLPPRKVQTLTVLSEELLRSTAPGTESRISRQLGSSVARGVNEAFLSPDNGEIPGVRPASITFGVTPIVATGTTAAAMFADTLALIAQADAAGADLERSLLVMSAARAFAVAVGAGGSAPGLGVRGGAFFGLPVAITDMASDDVVLIDASGVEVALGAIESVTAHQATLQMRDDPATGATSQVSMWQTNCAAVRVSLYANWARVRDDSVFLLTGPAS